jgi:hypothetical protein
MGLCVTLTFDFVLFEVPLQINAVGRGCADPSCIDQEDVNFGSVATLQECFDKLGRYGPRILSRRFVQMAPNRKSSCLRSGGTCAFACRTMMWRNCSPSEACKTHWIRAAISCGCPNGAMTTVNVYVICMIAHSFLERTAPDSPLLELLLRRIAHT